MLAIAGCSARRPAKPTEKPPTQPPVPSLEFGGSVIRIADPKGNWTFEARSAKIKAKTAEGPFFLVPADGIYQQTGQKPVYMKAVTASIDKAAGRVVLQENVRITSAAWILEADRVDYDLNTGKVVSPGRTKLTFQSSEDDRRLRQTRGRGEQ
jgi:hypothetical protein